MKRLLLIPLLVVLFFGSLFGNDITFTGGRTSLQTQGDLQVITLSQGARVTSDTIVLYSDTIVLSGEEFRYVRCTGNVRLVDEERNLSLETTRLFYDREKEEVLIDGYFELDDPLNELIARGFGLEYLIDSEKITLSAEAHLEKHTSKGVMMCSADLMNFDRKAMKLILSGKAQVRWANDVYEAQSISVDLDKEAISAEGSIRGVING